MSIFEEVGNRVKLAKRRRCEGCGKVMFGLRGPRLCAQCQPADEIKNGCLDCGAPRWRKKRRCKECWKANELERFNNTYANWRARDVEKARDVSRKSSEKFRESEHGRASTLAAHQRYEMKRKAARAATRALAGPYWTPARRAEHSAAMKRLIEVRNAAPAAAQQHEVRQ